MASRGSGAHQNYFVIAQASIIVSVAILLIIGLVMVYSTDSIESIALGGDPTWSLVKQLICIAAGTVALLVGRELGFLVRFAPVIIGLNIISDLFLLATFFLGMSALGATRWIEIPLFGSFQPSEFSKILILITVAYILSRYKNGSVSLQTAGILAAVGVGVPLAFIFIAQSDFGSTFICLIGIMAAFWIAGLDRKIFWMAIGAVVLVAVIAVVIAPYRMERVISHLTGNADSEGDALQITNSFYAIAQGGFFGVGIGNSTQKYQYLPEAETDFIFSIIVEELGLFGALIVIVLFLIILVASLYIALNASDEFGQILVAGLAVMLVFQAYFNIAVVLGIAPITGKTLPFLSKGGTSLVMNCLIIGLILSVAKDSDPERLAKKRRDDLTLVTGGHAGYGSAYGNSDFGVSSSRSSRSRNTSSERFHATSNRQTRR